MLSGNDRGTFRRTLEADLQVMGVSVMRHRPMPSPNDIREVGRRLRELSDSQPLNKTALRIWQGQAQEFQRFLEGSPDLAGSIPHFVWHYLADADIRLKDPEYRQTQQSTVEGILGFLESGEIPVDAA